MTIERDLEPVGLLVRHQRRIEFAIIAFCTALLLYHAVALARSPDRSSQNDHWPSIAIMLSLIGGSFSVLARRPVAKFALMGGSFVILAAAFWLITAGR